MKKTILILLITTLLITSFVSSEIIIQNQPESLYNIGDLIKTSFKIISSTDFAPDTFFLIDILCNGIETKIMQIPIGDLKAGEEREFHPPIPLLSSIMGRTTGTCKIKAVLKSLAGEEHEYLLTNEFEISDILNVEVKTKKLEYNPEETIGLEGNAIKENGNPVKGIVELKVKSGNDSIIETIDTVKNGYFYTEFTLPKETKSDEYPISIEVYELNSVNEKTNKGSANHEIFINQVPTNLEIVFENQKTLPGTHLKVKSILYDQTGEEIVSNTNLTIKNKEEILLTTEKETNKFLEFAVSYKEPPAEWTVIARSNNLISKANCEIEKKEAVKVELINKSLTITNIGNVIYNKSVSVDIGNDSLEIDVTLEIDETQNYLLTAPDGKYQVKVLTKEGDSIEGMAMLTGKAIEIKEAKEGMGSLMKHPLVWIFIILILGGVSFLIFKKGHKKIFFGKGPKGQKEKKESKKEIYNKKHSIINAKNKAELSLSIKGDKQKVSVICLKLKNLKEIISKKTNAEEALQKVADLAEEKKAFVYEAQENLFFILAPIKTRTFKNEKTAIHLAQKIQENLKEHNKIFKQPIDFGISLHNGTIIAKQEKHILKFMSLGNLITASKKIASLSKEEVLLSEEISKNIGSEIKTSKEKKGNINVYTIKEMKNQEENKKFIERFVKRLEKKD